MKHFIMTLAFIGSCLLAEASVLGIFETTNFPTCITGNDDGVRRLEVIDNELYAATENGIYKYSEDTNSWSCWALDGVNVLDFKVAGNEVVAIIVPQEHKGHKAVAFATLIRFNVNYSEWEDIMDLGMGYQYYDEYLTYIMRMAQHPKVSQQLMVAAYPGIWISEDFGTSWNFKFEWLFTYNENQFLGWHPTKTNVLFYTSEGDNFNAQILRSEDNGNTWNIINPDNTGDNSCHHLAFDPKDSNHILYSGEGCIFESNDCGKTWHCVYRQDDRDRNTSIGYAYNIMFDEQNENTVYAVGSISVNEEIRVFKSSDNGKTWTCIEKSEQFENKHYWINESVLLNSKIYIYTRQGVLAYNLDNNSASVGGIQADSNDTTEVYYDLSGRKVITPKSGTILIQDGKKILVK